MPLYPKFDLGLFVLKVYLVKNRIERAESRMRFSFAKARDDNV